MDRRLVISGVTLALYLAPSALAHDDRSEAAPVTAQGGCAGGLTP